MTKTLTFTLTVPEAKRLIAHGIIELPIIKKALEDHTLVLAHGIGNAYIYEALTATKIIDKSTYTAGIVVDGVACISGANPRMSSLVMRKGVQVEEDWLVALTKFGPNDVFIKGANSFDPSGNAGILLGGNGGGTIGKAYGHIRAAGSHLVTPVGYEKLIPSVAATTAWLGRDKVDYSIGVKCGQFMVSDSVIFTEVNALAILFDVEAIPIASGGIQDCRGAVTLAVRGTNENVVSCLSYIKSLKGEPEINGGKRSCASCPQPCER